MLTPIQLPYSYSDFNNVVGCVAFSLVLDVSTISKAFVLLVNDKELLTSSSSFDLYNQGDNIMTFDLIPSLWTGGLAQDLRTNQYLVSMMKVCNISLVQY